MATEQGIVIKVNPGNAGAQDMAWVKTTKTSACKSCSAKSSCHTLGGGNDVEVEAINSANAEKGDNVLMEFKNNPLFKAAFFLYIFPIICMVAGAAAGQFIAPAIGMEKSVSSALFGFLFFGLSLGFVIIRGNKMGKMNKYKPRIIKVLKNRL